MEIRALPDLPSVDGLAQRLAADLPHGLAIPCARQAIQEARERLLAGETLPPSWITERAVALARPKNPSVANLSGVVLHTGLGRARLAPSVAAEIARVANDHTALELDLETGERGDRQTLVRDQLRSLTGCEDSFVVNNCAGAVLLTLAALASPGSVVLSRGEMVEIGGSYRMPDVIAASGATLVEVGCTNKTHLADYEKALTPGATLLRCHQSNFKQIGFTSRPSDRELSALAQDKGNLFLHDLGSGCLVATPDYGLPPEKTMTEAIRDGADVVMASGDKLLGGPQAGLILGRADLIRQIRQHPLARALRIDKLCLAGLAATLQLYLAGKEAEIPLWRYCGKDLDLIKSDAEKLSQSWPGSEVLPCQTEIGGGTMPGESLASWACVIRPASPDSLAQALRQSHPLSVLGRVQGGALWLDCRTLDPEELPPVCDLLAQLHRHGSEAHLSHVQ